MVLSADSILARSTRRRQTSTGWNTAYIVANRYTLPPDEKPPADDALHPMAFLVEKGPGAVTRPHFHQADQFDGGDPLPANSCIFIGPEEPAFAGASGRVGAELLCLQFCRRARD